ncbi:ATP-binding protein [Streptomyces sp. NPDC091272]|uniref:ATP-binding response regulator n=1 Tax=Streptomyces sp. NPDC091272 TaxID=3365981 RepID=UPI0038156453
MTEQHPGQSLSPFVSDLLDLPLGAAEDVFVLRRSGQQACRILDLTGSAPVRLVTVLSELAQSLVGAAGLAVTLRVDGLDPSAPPRLLARFRWHDATVLDPKLVHAADRLLDECRYDPRPPDGGRGAELVVGQVLHGSVEAIADRAARACVELRGSEDVDVLEALRAQNRQLLAALEESRQQQDELQQLNEELEDTNSGVVALYSELAQELEKTNSGVVALYAELEDKTRQLGLASEAKTRFWANVSHELRSPVNSVISLAHLLLAPEGEPLSEEQVQQISLIAGSGNTMLALVEELLDVAKAESGRLDPHMVPTDLLTLLHQLRGTLLSTAQPGVVLDIPDVPQGLHLVTDEVMLTRVLRNVLSNGLKFTDAGTVRLTLGAEDRNGSPWFVFTVTDTGVGIPADQQDRIFEEFYQVRGPHQRGRSGTGLGLPYARKLTELLGGRLSLSSDQGKGTRVTVELPADPQLGVPGQGATGGPEPDPMACLVVIDDDPAFVASLRPALDRIALKVVEVTDVTTTLETVKKLDPQAILLDLMMPVLDGYQVLQQLAADPGTAHVPVVVLTSADFSDVDRSRLTHAREVLGKTHLTPARIASALSLRPPDAGAAPSPAAEDHDTA